MVGEDPLDRYHVRPVLAHPLGQFGLDPEQSLRQFQIGRSHDHPDVDQHWGAPRTPIDHADTAAGQTRINAEHTHGTTFRTCVRILTARLG